MPAETRAKISATLKRRYSDPDERKRLSETRKRYFEEHPEARQEMSEQRKQFLRDHPEYIEAQRGKPLSPETKAKLSASMKRRLSDPAEKKRRSEAQIRRWAQVREGFVASPTHKKCSGLCGQTKPVGDFYTRRQKLKSGVIRVYPEPLCKECKKAAMRKHWKRLEEEGKADEARRRKRQQVDPERNRAYQREWAAAKRRREGIKPRQLQRREEQETKEKGPFLPVGPIADLLAKELEGGDEQTIVVISELSGLDPRRLYAIRHHETPNVTLRVVDAILTGLGRSEEMHFLYPDSSGDRIDGYAYLEP